MYFGKITVLKFCINIIYFIIIPGPQIFINNTYNWNRVYYTAYFFPNSKQIIIPISAASKECIKVEILTTLGKAKCWCIFTASFNLICMLRNSVTSYIDEVCQILPSDESLICARDLTQISLSFMQWNVLGFKKRVFEFVYLMPISTLYAEP